MHRRALVVATTAVGFVAGVVSGDLQLAGLAAVFGYFGGETILSVKHAVRP
ncbi:hypothetical protein Halar_1535 [halophilic archaeon DL31]|jgi:hypothetical protein|nr:hypothetical protein Halar_1535 [halophilic archaeon DL31]